MSQLLLLSGYLMLSNVACIIAGQISSNRLIENKGNFKFPNSIKECADFILHPKYPKEIVQAVQGHCLDGFISLDHTHNWAANFTKDEQNYIGSLFRKIITDASSTNNVRHKREADSLFPRRVRREVRSAPYSNWLNYARNVRRLKYEEILPNGRSRWDIIADIHRIAVLSAHFGPNFLPWHRLYLIVMETALGTPIPYWQSTLDFDMKDPTQSILFTKRYFGNGLGLVRTGPFANFDTPIGRLFRNIGADGALFRRDGINLILRQLRLADISDQTAVEDASLEGQHNDVHNWVDGQMNNLEFSPHDPLFFTHHAFVDFIWEMFRTEQKKRGINPSLDYPTPPGNVTFQNITDPAVGLTGYYNNDGISEMIASLVHYLPVLSCPVCGNSPDLFCDTRRHVCVSKCRDPLEYSGTREEAMAIAMENDMMDDGRNCKPFPLYSRDMRVRMDSITLNYDNPTGRPQSNTGIKMMSNRNSQIVGRRGMELAVNAQTTTNSETITNSRSFFQSGLRSNRQQNIPNLLFHRERVIGNGELWNREKTLFGGIVTHDNSPQLGYSPYSMNPFFESFRHIPWNNFPEQGGLNVGPSWHSLPWQNSLPY